MSLLHKNDSQNSDRIGSWAPADFQPLEQQQESVIDVDSLLSVFTSDNGSSSQQNSEEGEGLLVNLPGQRTRYMNVKPWAFENLGHNGQGAKNNGSDKDDSFVFEELTPFDADHVENNGFHPSDQGINYSSISSTEEVPASIEDNVEAVEIDLPSPAELAQEEADRILEAARQQAEQLLQDAKQSVEEMTQQAYQEGLEKAKSETNEGLRQINTIIDTTAQWREQVLSQSEATLIEMVKQIAKRIFDDDFELDRRQLQKHFQQVLERARAMGDLKVYLHPEDAHLVGPDWRDNQMMMSGQSIQLLPSSAVQRGGCFIEGDLGTVDARIQTQLENVLEAIDEVAKSGATNGSSNAA